MVSKNVKFLESSLAEIKKRNPHYRKIIWFNAGMVNHGSCIFDLKIYAIKKNCKHKLGRYIYEVA